MNLQSGPSVLKPTFWHSSTAQDVLAALDSNRQGLSESEAARRLSRYGPNRLRPPVRRRALKRFALQFHNVLIYVLLASSVVTALLGHFVDTGVILGVVLINAVIGFVQEGKADRAIDAIRNMLSPRAIVLREGQRIEIFGESLVPGDVVALASGDRVPADLRLLQAKSLRIAPRC
jgi:magnesium-transporting ATPase (P-type)